MKSENFCGLLSVIIPAYNEEQSIKIATKTIHDILSNQSIPHEIIFVNDGSKDQTWPAICGACKEHTFVSGVCFSRNFGKEAAIFAGLAESKGNCCVVIDCDLQHPPEKIVEMYRLWQEGYEIVEGIKTDRGKESILHTLAAKTFYRLISMATGIEMENASDFKLLDRKAVDVLINMPEKNIFFRAVSAWVGFRTAQVYYEVQERQVGETKWSSKALVKYAVTNITSFTTVPMQIVTVLGALMFVGGFVLTVLTLMQKINGTAVDGFTTVIILQCLIGSIVMTSVGIVGYYISKIYDEVKARPRYIVSKTIHDRKTCCIKEEKHENK